jgi:3',5'-cyclic-AMP phosphodiesterase
MTINRSPSTEGIAAMPITLAHISDLHVDGNGAATERVARVVRHLDTLGARVDALVVTGDVADHGAEDEYELVRSLLRSDRPVVICPGNHDDRAALRRVLRIDARQGGDDPIKLAIDVGGLLVLACDSTVPGQDHGYLSDGTLAWLDQTLADAEPQVPAVLALHHPPEEAGIEAISPCPQRGSSRLAALLDRHRRVVAVLAGHAHLASVTSFAGRPLVVAPGVASSLASPWDLTESMHRQPPSLALHVIDGAAVLTHVLVVA